MDDPVWRESLTLAVVLLQKPLQFNEFGQLQRNVDKIHSKEAQ